MSSSEKILSLLLACMLFTAIVFTCLYSSEKEKFNVLEMELFITTGKKIQCFVHEGNEYWAEKAMYSDVFDINQKERTYRYNVYNVDVSSIVCQ